MREGAGFSAKVVPDPQVGMAGIRFRDRAKPYRVVAANLHVRASGPIATPPETQRWHVEFRCVKCFVLHARLAVGTRDAVLDYFAAQLCNACRPDEPSPDMMPDLQP